MGTKQGGCSRDGAQRGLINHRHCPVCSPWHQGWAAPQSGDARLDLHPHQQCQGRPGHGQGVGLAPDRAARQSWESSLCPQTTGEVVLVERSPHSPDPGQPCVPWVPLGSGDTRVCPRAEGITHPAQEPPAHRDESPPLGDTSTRPVPTLGRWQLLAVPLPHWHG